MYLGVSLTKFGMVTGGDGHFLSSAMALHLHKCVAQNVKDS